MKPTGEGDSTKNWSKGERIINSVIYFLIAALFYTIMSFAIPVYFVGSLSIIPFFVGIVLSLANGFIAYKFAGRLHLHWQILSVLIGCLLIGLPMVYSNQIVDSTSDAPYMVYTALLGLLVMGIVFILSLLFIKKLKWKILLYSVVIIIITVTATLLVMPVYNTISKANYSYLSARYPIEKAFSMEAYATPEITVPAPTSSALAGYEESLYIVDKGYNFKKLNFKPEISSYGIEVSSDKKYLYASYDGDNRNIKLNDKIYEAYIYEINSKNVKKLSVAKGLSRSINLLYLKDDQFLAQFYNRFGNSFAIINISTQTTEHYEEDEIRTILDKDYKGIAKSGSLKYGLGGEKRESFESQWDSKICGGDYTYDISRMYLFATNDRLSNRPNNVCFWTGHEDKVIFSDSDKQKAGIVEVQFLNPGLNPGEILMQTNAGEYILDKDGNLSQPFNLDGSKVDRFNFNFYFY